MSGLAQAREWDVVASMTTSAPGDEAVFVALPDSLVVEAGSEEAAAGGRRALEELIQPPYRAVAVRREGEVWAVGAVGIEVAVLGVQGEELTLVVAEDGSRSLTVDGRSAIVEIDELQAAAGGRFGAFVLRASRLIADTWEIQVDPL